MSVHKGQGSQFKAVIVPTERGNDRFGIIQKSIIYTALSRGIDMLSSPAIARTSYMRR
jgi:ATP-dependent exoDNAse (exonuclease V) alpha subunit